jgi:hypothetical protein
MWVIENCQFLINPFHHAGLLGNNEIKRLVSFIALLLFASPGLTQTVVLDAKPTVKVESNKDTTKRDLLSKRIRKSIAFASSRTVRATYGHLVRIESWYINYPVPFIFL